MLAVFRKGFTAELAIPLHNQTLKKNSSTFYVPIPDYFFSRSRKNHEWGCNCNYVPISASTTRKTASSSTSSSLFQSLQSLKSQLNRKQSMLTIISTGNREEAKWPKWSSSLLLPSGIKLQSNEMEFGKSWPNKILLDFNNCHQTIFLTYRAFLMTSTVTGVFIDGRRLHEYV